jgi:Uma2 family endonuclease
VSPQVATNSGDDTTLIDGVPTLVVEILSPSDKEEETDEKIDAYLEAGVPLVWIVDPHFQTITVYRPSQEPEFFSKSHTISGADHLPGFQVRVAEIFED